MAVFCGDRRPRVLHRCGVWRWGRGENGGFYHVLPSDNLTWLWKIIMFHGKIHYKWWCFIVMLNYQRVLIGLLGIRGFFIYIYIDMLLIWGYIVTKCITGISIVIYDDWIIIGICVSATYFHPRDQYSSCGPSTGCVWSFPRFLCEWPEIREQRTAVETVEKGTITEPNEHRNNTET